MDADPIQSTNPVLIPARTRRLAMDWALVLASQGIEATIHDDPQSGWALAVAHADQGRAIASIKAYHHENVHWQWQQSVLESGLLFDWFSGAWALLTVVFYWLSQVRSGLLQSGVADSVAIAHGQWWRLFTAIFLHGDFVHLTGNAVFGFVLIALAMGRYGTGIGMLVAFLAGVAGNVASWLVHPEPHAALGASGVVMGALGLIAAQSIPLFKRNAHPWRVALAGLIGGIMIFVLLGLSPGSDVVAHLGGFVAGIILGAALAPIPLLAQRPVVNLIAGLAFATLVILTWLLALRG